MPIKFTLAELEILTKVEAGEEEFDPNDDLYLKIYEYFLGSMPYGTAKARTGDPGVWISEHLHELLDGSYREL